MSSSVRSGLDGWPARRRQGPASPTDGISAGPLAACRTKTGVHRLLSLPPVPANPVGIRDPKAAGAIEAGGIPAVRAFGPNNLTIE